MAVNILCVGDVVGRPGRRIMADRLGDLIAERQIEFVVCNAENAAGGSGLTTPICRQLVSWGVDVITLGDHVYRKRDIIPAMRDSERLVRPANLSPMATGRRWTVLPTKSGRHRVGVLCLLGQMFMGSADSPWAAAEDCLERMDPEVRIRVVDFHAEASSEKIAMGWHLNGRVSIVFGTHTHIPTADARVLSGGTAHISDVGMTGPYDSVLGRRRDRVLGFLTTSMPQHFEVASADVRLCGVLVGVDPDSGRALSIERVEVAGEASDEGTAPA